MYYEILVDEARNVSNKLADMEKLNLEVIDYEMTSIFNHLCEINEIIKIIVMRNSETKDSSPQNIFPSSFSTIHKEKSSFSLTGQNEEKLSKNETSHFIKIPSDYFKKSSLDLMVQLMQKCTFENNYDLIEACCVMEDKISNASTPLTASAWEWYTNSYSCESEPNSRDVQFKALTMKSQTYQRIEMTIREDNCKFDTTFLLKKDTKKESDPLSDVMREKYFWVDKNCLLYQSFSNVLSLVDISDPEKPQTRIIQCRREIKSFCHFKRSVNNVEHLDIFVADTNNTLNLFTLNLSASNGQICSCLNFYHSSHSIISLRVRNNEGLFLLCENEEELEYGVLFIVKAFSLKDLLLGSTKYLVDQKPSDCYYHLGICDSSNRKARRMVDWQFLNNHICIIMDGFKNFIYFSFSCLNYASDCLDNDFPGHSVLTLNACLSHLVLPEPISLLPPSSTFSPERGPLSTFLKETWAHALKLRNTRRLSLRFKKKEAMVGLVDPEEKAQLDGEEAQLPYGLSISMPIRYKDRRGKVAMLRAFHWTSPIAQD